MVLCYPVGQKFAQNCSISYSFRDIHTFSFSAKIQDGHQNRSILNGLGDIHIYVFCYVAITQEVKAITINNNTKQAIDPINLHTKFYKDELNTFLLKE